MLVVPPHVCSVDTPDTLGVHWNTYSGAVFVVPHVPVRALAPAVTPVNTPPAGGITVAVAHVPAGNVVVVLLVVLVVVLLLEVVVLEVVLMLVVVLFVVDVVVTVELVVVVGRGGGVTVRLNAPLAPLKPSTKMK
jgi:hypothetical protein